MIYTIFELAQMNSRHRDFESFIADGKELHPDVYLCRENEDFSPEAAVDTGFFNSFAERITPELDFGLIA